MLSSVPESIYELLSPLTYEPIEESGQMTRDDTQAEENEEGEGKSFC